MISSLNLLDLFQVWRRNTHHAAYAPTCNIHKNADLHACTRSMAILSLTGYFWRNTVHFLTSATLPSACENAWAR